MATETSRLDAIEAVYRARAADLFRVALAMTRDVERAHDAVQEGFARAIKHRDGFRGSGSLEAWICRCVLNAARDQRPEVPPERTNRDEPSARADVDRPDDTLRNAVLALPQRQREALFLRYYLDFDYTQIADALGIRIGTVSATLHAARAALGKALTEVA